MNKRGSGSLTINLSLSNKMYKRVFLGIGRLHIQRSTIQSVLGLQCRRVTLLIPVDHETVALGHADLVVKYHCRLNHRTEFREVEVQLLVGHCPRHVADKQFQQLHGD